MNYMNYYPVDVVNGKGTRATLFVSGCSHKCKGCFAKKSWNPENGHPFTKEIEDIIIADLKDERIKRSGLSLLGGDPLFSGNLVAIKSLIERVRKESPSSNIWLWSGEVLSNLSPVQKEIVQMVDVFIDGKFEEDKADPSLKWRGSSNQKIHKINTIANV